MTDVIKLYTEKEVCAILRCSKRTLGRMMERGDIAYTHRRGCHILFSQSAVDKYLKSIEVSAS